jgi:hypothetical protein
MGKGVGSSGKADSGFGFDADREIENGFRCLGRQVRGDVEYGILIGGLYFFDPGRRDTVA